MAHFGDSTLNLDTTLAYKVKLTKQDYECKIYTDNENSMFKGIIFILCSFVLFVVPFLVFEDKSYGVMLLLTGMGLIFLGFGIKLVVSKTQVRIYSGTKKIEVLKFRFGKIIEETNLKFTDIEEVRVELISGNDGRMPLSYQKEAASIKSLNLYPEVSILLKNKKYIIFLTSRSRQEAIELATTIATDTESKLTNCFELIK